MRVTIETLAKLMNSSGTTIRQRINDSKYPFARIQMNAVNRTYFISVPGLAKWFGISVEELKERIREVE